MSHPCSCSKLHHFHYTFFWLSDDYEICRAPLYSLQQASVSYVSNLIRVNEGLHLYLQDLNASSFPVTAEACLSCPGTQFLRGAWQARSFFSSSHSASHPFHQLRYEKRLHQEPPGNVPGGPGAGACDCGRGCPRPAKKPVDFVCCVTLEPP